MVDSTALTNMSINASSSIVRLAIMKIMKLIFERDGNRRRRNSINSVWRERVDTALYGKKVDGRSLSSQALYNLKIKQIVRRAELQLEGKTEPSRENVMRDATLHSLSHPRKLIGLLLRLVTKVHVHNRRRWNQTHGLKHRDQTGAQRERANKKCDGITRPFIALKFFFSLSL